MKSRLKSRRGQTMIEYIIIVVLIAISGIVLYSYLSKAMSKKVAGATSALDAEAGSEAQSAAESINPDRIKNLSPDGTFN